VVKAYQFLSAEKREYVLSSNCCAVAPIETNVTEADGAISDATFFRQNICAYKECLE
jgi:hypothetical protein